MNTRLDVVGTSGGKATIETVVPPRRDTSDGRSGDRKKGAEHMGTSRFVRPETCTLKISCGDTLTVKRQLTAGEQRASYARMYQAGRVDPLQVGLAIITAYLIDWTVTDDAGAVVPIRGMSADELVSVLDSLSMEAFTEIKDAVEAHVSAMDAAREEKKTLTQTGARAS